MKLLRKLTSLIAIILMPSIFTSTFQANPCLNANNTNTFDVAVLIYSFNDAFSLKLIQELEAIQRINEDKIRFNFYDGKNNIAIQNETLDLILRSNIDLIIGNLADVRKSFVGEAILKVKQRDIPLILLNIDPQVVSKVSKYYNKVAFILPDSKESGTIQGKILVNLWNTNRKVLDKNNDNILQYALLQGKADNPQAIDRTKYVISAINNSGIKTEQLANIDANWSKELAKDSITNLFLKYDGKIETIISNNDAMAIGAIESLQKFGYNKGDKTKNIAVVGIDALPEARDLVNRGIMTGTVVQDPKILAETLYTIGMNLVNNLPPTENTNYKIVNGVILVPYLYKEYTGKTDVS